MLVISIFSSSSQCFLPLSQTTNFGLHRIDKFADDNLKFDENDRKLSKQVENTVGKGEIHERAISHFPTAFLKRRVLQTCKTQDLFGKGLKVFIFRAVKTQDFAVKSLKRLTLPINSTLELSQNEGMCREKIDMQKKNLLYHICFTSIFSFSHNVF